MPDHTPTGRRLHAERLIARGLRLEAEPSQPVRDYARDFVQRIVADASRPPSDGWMLLAGIAFGSLVGWLFGTVVVR